MKLRHRSLLIGAVAALIAGGTAAVVTQSAATAAPAAAPAVTDPGTFVPLAPARILDTRGNPGAAPVGPLGSLPLQLGGQGGVPATGVSSVVLNVTVTQPGAAGYLTVWPNGRPRPNASNLNFVAGQTVPNSVIVAVGSGGIVNLFNGSTGSVQLIADVSGYYVAGTATDAGALVSLDPARLLDTRDGTGGSTAPGALGIISLPVAGHDGIPASASAVVLNVTVTQPTSAGYITVWGNGGTQPVASNLNFTAGQTVPNLVVTPLGSDGAVALFNGSMGTVQLLADVAGYYLGGTPTALGTFVPVTPGRLVDTRSNLGAVPAAAFQTASFPVEGRQGVPNSGVAAAVLNVTVTQPTAGGYITAQAGGTTHAPTSSLNFTAGQTVPNLVVVPVGANGAVELSNGSIGSTQLIADVAGYVLGSPVTTTAPGNFEDFPTTPVVSNAPLLGVSCPLTTFCMAVGPDTPAGRNSATWNGSSWSTVGATANGPEGLDGFDGFFAVSCVSPTWCVAVGADSQTKSIIMDVWQGTTWTPMAQTGALSNTPMTVSCVSATWCLAVGSTGFAIWNGTTWTVEPQSLPDNPGASRWRVSCPAVDSCMAVDGTRSASWWNGSAWSAVPLSNLDARLRDVSCASTSSCTAVGDQNNGCVANLIGGPVTYCYTKPVIATGSASGLVTVNSPLSFNIVGPDAEALTNVSCASAVSCEAVGYTAPDAGAAPHITVQPLYESWDGSRWTLGEVRTPTSGWYGYPYLYGVSCPSTTICAAVGWPYLQVKGIQ